MLYASALLLCFPLGFAIQALRVPELTVSPTTAERQRALPPLFAKALSSPQASTLELTLDELNAHLAQTLLPPKPSASPWTLQRITLRLAPGKVDVLTLQDWHGWKLHLHATYAVSLKGGKTRLQLLSGTLGRLPLSAHWMTRLLDRPFAQLLPPLRKEHVLFDRLDDLKIDAQRIQLFVRISTPS